MSRPNATGRPALGVPTSRSTSATKEPLHLPLHRRLLFPTYPPGKPLPVLLPGDGPDIALLNERYDMRLSIRYQSTDLVRIYHLIALALRAYVLSWLPRITRDRSLLPHIHAQIIAPLLIPIFTHLSTHPDALIPLLLYDLPGVLTLHWKTYWHARQTTYILPGPLDSTYHADLPLLCAVPSPPPPEETEEGRTPIPEGQYIVSGLWLTAMADTLIKNSLPVEDYKITVQRTMVREIIGRTVLGSVARRIGEPWFWWTLFQRFLPTTSSTPSKSPSEDTDMFGQIASGIWGIWTVCVKIWAGIIWLGTMFTAAPTARYSQTTECWVELLREILNVDGRGGRGNWALRIVWGIVEAFLFLLSSLLDRSVF